MTVTRRHVLGAAAASPVLIGWGGRVGAQGRTLRFSYQRSSTLLTVLKQQGTLEKRLGENGFGVGWYLFNDVVPPMTSSAVDFHADVADAVPIFTQAAGARITLYAREAPSPRAEAIVVHEDSPIRSVADLKGKTVAVHRGSGVHYVLAAALNRAGLAFSDITPAYLAPTDGGPAFMSRKVDAWAIWDPFLAITESRTKVRKLADASGLSSYYRYYLAEDALVAGHPELVGLVFDALVEAGRWVKSRPKEAIALLGPIWGNVPDDVIAVVNGRRSYEVLPIDPAQLGDQQRIADVFHEARLIPRALDATAVKIWSPRPGRT